MGTHPIFESDFDCLTEWRRIESQFFLLEAECMMEVKFTKHLLLWSLFLVTMLRSLALLQISHSSTRSITALELLMKKLETFYKKARESLVEKSPIGLSKDRTAPWTQQSQQKSPRFILRKSLLHSAALLLIWLRSSSRAAL